jgi:hypothetical protein
VTKALGPHNYWTTTKGSAQQAASVVDGWLRSHLKAPLPSLQSALAQLDQLLDASSFPIARRRGAAMSFAELADHVDEELTRIIDENTVNSS